MNLLVILTIMLSWILGCSANVGAPKPEWTKSHKIAGKEQKLSHLSGAVVDDKFAYATIGGTVADQHEGTSGLRKIALDTGAVTNLENGENFPQAETGGIALDDKFVYWNGGNQILRISKDGGKPEIVASEKVGIGIDMVVDGEKVYWANHGYYSPNAPAKPSPIYMAAKTGGKTEIFADAQNVPHSLAVDDKFVYWVTPSSILKQAKSGGQVQTVYQATDKEGVDELAADADNLYFAFRAAGDSRWSLRKIPKQGGEPKMLVKDFSTKPFVVDDANVYFFSDDGLCKVAKNGGDAVTLDTGYAGGVITQSKTDVYFGSLDDIYSFKK